MADTAPNSPKPQPEAWQWSPDSMDPRRCVILVPFLNHISMPCQCALEELQRRGYDVWRVGGYTAIDQSHNQTVTDALAAGYAETFWIDSDIDFHPDAVDLLRAHRLPIVGAIYARKGVRAIASQLLPDTAKLTMGQGGGLVEILYAASGFLHVRREVYETVQQQLALPTCNEQYGRSMIPFFQPMVHMLDTGPVYLAEDFAFCERARQCGFKIMADTSVRLWHIGEYSFGWEDAAQERQRHNSFQILIENEKK